MRKLFTHYVPFTAMFNITGQPAISLPLAWSDAGLPIGVQLVGRYADDAALVRLVRTARAGAALGRPRTTHRR